MLFYVYVLFVLCFFRIRYIMLFFDYLFAGLLCCRPLCVFVQQSKSICTTLSRRWSFLRRALQQRWSFLRHALQQCSRCSGGCRSALTGRRRWRFLRRTQRQRWSLLRHALQQCSRRTVASGTRKALAPESAFSAFVVFPYRSLRGAAGPRC